MTNTVVDTQLAGIVCMIPASIGSVAQTVPLNENLPAANPVRGTESHYVSLKNDYGCLVLTVFVECDYSCCRLVLRLGTRYIRVAHTETIFW